MNGDRRRFLRQGGFVGLGLAGRNLTPERDRASGQASPGGSGQAATETPAPRWPRFNMAGFAAPPLDKVRIGIVGLGQRGPGHLKTVARVEGVEIRGLCDLRPEKVEAAQKLLAGSAHHPESFTGEEGWKRLCEREDVDLVMITTPWTMHAAMAVYAMNHGKHVASEVPAASTLEECWQLVATAEQTRRHCMMLENYSYGAFPLLTLNMARRGFFGEVVHADCAYNTSKMRNNFDRNMYWDMWWLKQYASRRGNIYPTHGLGPVSQVMGINRGDRFELLVSVESRDFMMAAKAKELAATDDFFEPFAAKTFRGNMSVTTIRTARGRTIMLQHDATSPSPHNLIHGIYGTKGAALFDPPPPRLSVGNDTWVSPEEFAALEKEHAPKITQLVSELARKIGAGHWGTDLFIDWRLVDCLRNGIPLDQDVYDAAVLSSIVPLSQWSVLNRSNSIDVPDFTNGAWERNPSNMDIMLERGGTTRVIV